MVYELSCSGLEEIPPNKFQGIFKCATLFMSQVDCIYKIEKC